TSTSGVAAAGSKVQIRVSLDQATLDTLDATTYTGTITMSPVNSANGTYPVSVSLNVAAGQPVLCAAATATGPCAGIQTPIFPPSLPSFPQSPSTTPVPPIITLYGDNFFYSSSHVYVTTPTTSFPLETTWVSRRIMTATIPVMRLTPPQVSAAGE